MSDFIPLSMPCIQGNEWKYIKECLDTEWVSSVGKFVDRFEENICKFTGAKYAIACVNGTSALHISLMLVGVKPGEEVIVPTLTFIAPINTVRYIGAHPVFMDCDDYYNIDVEKTIKFIKEHTTFKNGFTYNKTTGKRISAIIPVHVFGNAVNLEELEPVCIERNIKIVEDAAESLGAYYIKGILKNKYTGTIGELGCYSFNGNKIITTGGGGMIVTDNDKIADKARYLTTQAKDNSLNFIHNEIGYNYRLTNIQAAMGVAQLEQLPEYLTAKRNNYVNYKKNIDGITGLKIADVPNYAQNNYWMVELRIDTNKYEKEKLVHFLAQKGIETRPIWHLNHLQVPYKKCMNYLIEKAYQLLKNTLNLPNSVNIKEETIERVIKTLKNG